MDSPKQNESFAVFGCLWEQNDKSLNGTSNVSVDAAGNATTCGNASLTPSATPPRQKGILPILYSM